MSKLRICGGRRLEGSLTVQGAKNSVLPILAASLLAGRGTVIHNCPALSDVDAAVVILEHLGCAVSRAEDKIYVDPCRMSGCCIPDSLMREMRSSVFFLGPILARTGEAVLSMPGGCELGPRPIGFHLDALRAMGAEISEKGGNIVCKAPRLRGCRIDLPMPSVGATENAMLAATAADGVTTITNAAREPEIVDLQNYLSALGARVCGAGTPVITVTGGICRRFCEYTVMPDRIAAATFMACAASAGGDVTLENVRPGDLDAVSAVFSAMGCELSASGRSLRLKAPERLSAPGTVPTAPYPGFPTDAQPPVMAAALKAAGTTVFVENIFSNRYRHVPELLRMGAEITLEGRVAIVSGRDKLAGAAVEATDLRGGAALVAAAVGAEGVSEVSGIRHLDRGYEHIEDRLRQLGADIVRI